MEERLKPARPRFVWRIEPQHGQVGVSRVVDHPAQPGAARSRVFDIDRLARVKRECCRSRVRGGEPDDRGPLCGLAFSHEVGATDGGYRVLNVEIGLVEEPEHELLPQQPAYRLVDASLADTSGADQLDDQLRP